MKIGDRVRLIGIPADLRDEAEMQTRALFETCLGESFTVAGLKDVAGFPSQLVQLDVGHLRGKAAFLESIWVEPEYLQLDKSS